MAANRLMAAQALGVCGIPDTAFDAIRREVEQAEDGYVFLFARNAPQYSHTDGRLGREDLERLEEIAGRSKPEADRHVWEYALRLIQDAIGL